MSCLTCRNYAPKESGAMAKQGYAICKLQPKWTYFAPTHSCSKHEPAPPEVIEARRKWAGK